MIFAIMNVREKGKDSLVFPALSVLPLNKSRDIGNISKTIIVYQFNPNPRRM